MSARPSPEGYPVVTPYLIVPGVSRLIEFLTAAFGAEEVQRVPRADGSLMHAEVRISGAPVMMGEPTPEWPSMPSSIYLYVEDCDATHRRAVESGGESVMEPTTMDHGDRYGGVRDPSGNVWWVATQVAGRPAGDATLQIEALSWKQGA